MFYDVNIACYHLRLQSSLNSPLSSCESSNHPSFPLFPTNVNIPSMSCLHLPLHPTTSPHRPINPLPQHLHSISTPMTDHLLMSPIPPPPSCQIPTVVTPKSKSWLHHSPNAEFYFDVFSPPLILLPTYAKFPVWQANSLLCYRRFHISAFVKSQKFQPTSIPPSIDFLPIACRIHLVVLRLIPEFNLLFFRAIFYPFPIPSPGDTPPL